MSTQANRTERICDAEDCIGVCVTKSGMCWAHAPNTELTSALSELRSTGHVDASGTRLTSPLLEAILAAAPRDDHDRVMLVNLKFARCTFEGDVNFDGIAVSGSADFNSAVFSGRATFNSAQLGHARFDNAKFKRNARFANTSFVGDASFGRVEFDEAVLLDRVTTDGSLSFADARFSNACHLGPILAGNRIDLDGSEFWRRVVIEATAPAVSGHRARFIHGVHFRLRWAEVTLEDADMEAPSTVNDASAYEWTDEASWLHKQRTIEAVKGHTGRPRLMSLRRSNVAGLVVARADLRACRFAGAYHLDKLRVADEAQLGFAPRTWWRTARRTIAEEHHWRAERHPKAFGSSRWYGPAQHPSSSLVAPPIAAPPAGHIAAMYRELRKGREDVRNEPGAADFYYGEMEMRRYSSSPRVWKDYRDRDRGTAYGTAASAFGEHTILTLYWLLSGYGLRAWRSFVALVALILSAGVIFAFWGLGPSGVQAVGVTEEGAPIYVDAGQPSGWDQLTTGVRISAQASTSLLRGSEAPLTPVGECLHLGLRLLGPILIGLALVSVRGRVRR